MNNLKVIKEYDLANELSPLETNINENSNKSTDIKFSIF